MKKYLVRKNFLLLCGCCLLAACTTSKLSKEQKTDPCAQTAKLSGGTVFNGNTNGSKPLSGSPYSYEVWTEGGNNNTFTWYGANQGGGAAFKAEWNNARDYLGRAGYFWNEGAPYTAYKNVFCDFNFTRSANGTGGGYSYIGVYGWSLNPMIEWYIVDDWYGDGIVGTAQMSRGAVKKGEFKVDGATYIVYQATRPAGSGNILGSNVPFTQYFSIRQTRRQCGTISVTAHFKEWEKLGLKLGSNMWEAKFLVEAGGGTGWFDASYLSFYQK